MQGLSSVSASLPLPTEWFERHFQDASASPERSQLPGSLNVVLRCAAPKARSIDGGRQMVVDAVLPDVPLIAIGQGKGARRVLQVCR